MRPMHTNTARRLMLACALPLLLAAPASRAADDAGKGAPPLLLQKPLKSGLDEGVVLVVTLPPGAMSAPHRHDANVFVYMLEGEMVTQLQGGPEVTLKPGDTFYENPNDVHTQARNASKTAPAKFVVFMVKKKGAPVLTPAH